MNPKLKRTLICLTIVPLIAASVIFLNAGRKRANNRAVRLVFIGYTNVNGSALAQFKIQNDSHRRIWIRHADYLMGEAYQQPANAWACSISDASTRWGNASPIPQEYVPPEPTASSPEPTILLVPVPPNQIPWRIGITVEFNTGLSERIHTAWKPKYWWMLKSGQFINNSADAIWTESQIITNSISDSMLKVRETSQPEGAANNSQH